MVYHFSPKKVPFFVGILLLLLSVSIGVSSPGEEAEGTGTSFERKCPSGGCIFVESDGTLSREARMLGEALHRRLCRFGVRVSFQKPGPELGPCPRAGHVGEKLSASWWVVHLRVLSGEDILVALDHLGKNSDEDLIRELPKGPDPGATSWTIALMVEDALMPYLDPLGESAPLGAGLSIIEPLVVGGHKRVVPKKKKRYPVVRSIGLGLEFTYLGMVTDSISDVLAGPRIGVQVLLGPRFVSSFQAGWLGMGHYEYRKLGIEGAVSHVPLELFLGYIPFKSRLVRLTIMGGLSAGFTVYQTTSVTMKERRTDFFFDPWFALRVGLDVTLFGPLAAYLDAGMAFFMLRDTLEKNREKVYIQDWLLPAFGVGIQVQFE